MFWSEYFKQKREQRRAEIYSALIHHEAREGGKLFGPIPEGHRREFFCLDERTWVWHEEWQDESGEWQAMTTRYDVRPGGILKTQGSNPPQRMSEQELTNFYRAITLYSRQVSEEHHRILAAV